jgi:hypothetical protein
MTTHTKNTCCNHNYPGHFSSVKCKNKTITPPKPHDYSNHPHDDHSTHDNGFTYGNGFAYDNAIPCGNGFACGKKLNYHNKNYSSSKKKCNCS